jgi:amidase
MNLLHRSAFAIATDIKAKKITAREVLEFFLERVERYNGGLNAVVALDETRARARAGLADIAITKGEDWGPLHGVPMTIKDALLTEGLVTVGGIPECSNNIPTVNAVAVQRYIDAGAIVFGKTNVPFMSSDLQSFNDVYGVTNNPWNTQRTCGGSSGGSASALAAGLTPLELGSDIGGSIRTPCHFNGVFGHKPSFGIVSQRGLLPPGERTLSESDMSVIGPLGTCVDDLEQALDIVCGASGEDAAAWKLDLPQASFNGIEQLRVAVWSDDPFCPVDIEISQAINAAAASLASAGAHVDYAARPDFDPQLNETNYALLLMAEMGGGMPESVYDMAAEAVAAANVDDMSQPLLQLRGISLSHRSWLKQSEAREKIRAKWASFFENFDVLLCPCAMVSAFPHDHNPNMHARVLSVNGQERPYTDILSWAGLTLNAYLPATAVPVGISSEGLPIGMQVVAPFLADRSALAAARLLEQHHRRFEAPPGYQ